MAVKHRQGPKIARLCVNPEGHGVADGVQIAAAMVIDHALGVAGRARGIIERQIRPLVIGAAPGVIRVAAGNERFIVGIADLAAAWRRRIVDIDDENIAVHLAQRLGHHGRILPVDDKRLGFAMVKNEGDHGRIQAIIYRVEHRAQHRHAEMTFQHFGNIGRHHRHGVAGANAPQRESRSETPAARIEFGVTIASVAINYRGLVGKHQRAALQETHRRKRGIVRQPLIQAGIEG